MANAKFLFNGGNYKIDQDDGRERLPLNPMEAELLFLDPELLSETGTSHGAELDMSEYASRFCDLAVGDEIFMGVLPDAAFYRGIWMHMYNKVDGFTVDVDLVPVKDVWDAYQAGDACGVDPLAGAETQAADFTDGVCQATKDACDLATLWQKDQTQYENYRNNDGQVATPFDPVYAGLGQSLYIRVTVTALGSLGTADTKKCGTCKGNSYPSFKAGAVLDTLCGDKQRVVAPCCGVKAPCQESCGEPAVKTFVKGKAAGKEAVDKDDLADK